MTAHQIGPVYCPNCRKELVQIGSVCSYCGYRVKYAGVKDFKTQRFRFERKRTEEELKKFRSRAGYLISGLTLPCLIAFASVWTNGNLYYLIYLTPWFFFLYWGFISLFLAFLVNIIGLGLVFFSIKPKSRGIFLITFGYLLFIIVLLIQPPINYQSIRNIPLYLIFIDIPILTMIIFGIYNIYNYENKTIPDIICFIPVLFSNIFPYIFYLFP